MKYQVSICLAFFLALPRAGAEHRNDTATENTRLVAADAAAGTNFGSAMEMSGNWPVSGASSVNDFRGAAYLFEFDAGEWKERAQLVTVDRGTPLASAS